MQGRIDANLPRRTRRLPSNAREVGRAKQALCRAHGFEGLFPLDEAIDTGLSPDEQARGIYRNCLAMMERADAILANLTPFREVSADVGTAFELGWFVARNKRAVAYSSDDRDIATRLDTHGLAGDGLAVEDFGWPDNLMLPGGVEAWVTRPAPAGEEIAALAAFEAAVQWLAEHR